MNNKRSIIIVSFLVLISLGVAVFQYAKNFQAEMVDAYGSSNPGHTWAEMECTSGLCVTSSNKVGIGTDAPVTKLDVTGDIHASGNICDGNGNCLGDINSFVAGQPLVNNRHTRADCTAAGGSVLASDVSYPLCHFIASSCPSGWLAYESYGKYSATTCTGWECDSGWCTIAPHSRNVSCTTAAADWGNSRPTCSYPNDTSVVWETCSLNGWGNSCSKQPAATCSATYTQIGCY